MRGGGELGFRASVAGWCGTTRASAGSVPCRRCEGPRTLIADRAPPDWLLSASWTSRGTPEGASGPHQQGLGGVHRAAELLGHLGDGQPVEVAQRRAPPGAAAPSGQHLVGARCVERASHGRPPRRPRRGPPARPAPCRRQWSTSLWRATPTSHATLMCGTASRCTALTAARKVSAGQVLRRRTESEHRGKQVAVHLGDGAVAYSAQQRGPGLGLPRDAVHAPTSFREAVLRRGRGPRSPRRGRARARRSAGRAYPQRPARTRSARPHGRERRPRAARARACAAGRTRRACGRRSARPPARGGRSSSRSRPPPRGPLRSSGDAVATTRSRAAQQASSSVARRSASTGRSSHGPRASGAPKSVVVVPGTVPTTCSSQGARSGANSGATSRTTAA